MLVAALARSVVVVPTEDREWTRPSQIEDGGVVLVRPDSKVCWRVTSAPSDPAEALLGALNVVLAGGSAADAGDPAEPFMQRIRRAASRLVR